MIEKFTDVFTKGTKMTFKNPVLFLPYLLYTILMILMMGIMLAFLLPGEESEAFLFFFILIFFLFFPLALILAVIEFFIRVGLLGMAKDVVLTGKTSFSQLFRYGKQYFIQVFCIGLITVIAASIGYILLFFVLNIAMDLVPSFGLAGSSLLPMGGIAVLVLVGCVGLIWVLVAQSFFYFARYAAVVNDLPFEDAIRQSFSLFKANKLKVFIFVFIAFVLPVIPYLLMNAVSSLFSYLPIFSEFNEQTLMILTIIAMAVVYLILIIFSALIPVWSTNMYLWLAKKESENEDENKTDEENENKTDEVNETKTVEETETSIESQEQEVSFD